MFKIPDGEQENWLWMYWFTDSYMITLNLIFLGELCVYFKAWGFFNFFKYENWTIKMEPFLNIIVWVTLSCYFYMTVNIEDYTAEEEKEKNIRYSRILQLVTLLRLSRFIVMLEELSLAKSMG
jgi:hypothetical protein